MWGHQHQYETLCTEREIRVGGKAVAMETMTYFTVVQLLRNKKWFCLNHNHNLFLNLFPVLCCLSKTNKSYAGNFYDEKRLFLQSVKTASNFFFFCVLSEQDRYNTLLGGFLCQRQGFGDRWCCMCTDCKVLTDKCVVCDFWLYNINWILSFCGWDKNISFYLLHRSNPKFPRQPAQVPDVSIGKTLFWRVLHLLREHRGHGHLRLWTHVSVLHLWPQTQEDVQRLLSHLQKADQRHHQDLPQHVEGTDRRTDGLPQSSKIRGISSGNRNSGTFIW